MSAVRDLVIFGAGGLGRETAAWLCDVERSGASLRLRGFVVEDEKLHGQRVDDLEVLPGVAGLVRMGYDGAVAIAVGDPGLAHTIRAQICDAGLELERPVLIHPSVVLDPSRVSLAAGCLIAPGAILATGVSLGEDVFVNTAACLSHDVMVGSHTRIHPRALLCGGVQVGERALIGAASAVMQYKRVGDAAQVAMGAIVGADVPSGAVAAGNPARIVRRAAA